MHRDQQFRDQPSLLELPVEGKTPPAGDARDSAATLTRASHPETSRLAAAQLMTAGKFAGDEAAAMELVEAFPGRMGYELDKIDGNTNERIRKRLGGLANKGLLRRGKRRMCGVKGSQCVTWYLVENNASE